MLPTSRPIMAILMEWHVSILILKLWAFRPSPFRPRLRLNQGPLEFVKLRSSEFRMVPIIIRGSPWMVSVLHPFRHAAWLRIVMLLASIRLGKKVNVVCPGAAPRTTGNILILRGQVFIHLEWLKDRPLLWILWRQCRLLIVAAIQLSQYPMMLWLHQ